MKKLMIATIIVLPLILLAILLVSGAIMSMTSFVYVERLEISETSALILEMPDEQNPPTHDLMKEVIIFPLQATNRDLTFSSDNEDIVTINEEGIITAIGYGSTFVHATSKENIAATDVREIIVTDHAAHIIKFDCEIKNEMYQGTTQQLKAVVLPENADDTTYHWESSNENILQVSASGNINAKGFGTATITAISNDNNDIRVSVDITSYPVMTSLEVNTSPLTTSETIVKFPNVTINPNNSGIKLSYKSSNEDVATVDGQGNITFKDAGKVEISVIATDFGGYSIEKTKTIISTCGYYSGRLFSQQTFTVDYDKYANGEILPIEIKSDPVGAYKLIESVTYDIEENVLKFDTNTNKFTFVGPMPQGKDRIKVTVFATVYDAERNVMNEQYEESFTLIVTRKATMVKASYLGEEVSEIRTTQKRFSFLTDSTQGLNTINIWGLPANHTDDWRYEVVSGGDIATLEGGNLTFNSDGTVIVRLSLIRGEERHAQTEISITSVSLKSFEKQIEVNKQEKWVELTSNGETEESGIIFLNTPSGTNLNYSILDDNGVVKLEQDNGIYKIVPLKGGFSTIQIEAIGVARDVQQWIVNVYVDKPVSERNFEIEINGSDAESFRTSLTAFEYSVTASNDSGEMYGKEIYIVVGGVETKVNGLSKNETINFNGKNEIEVRFEVRYAANVVSEYKVDQRTLVSLRRTVSTTNGKLDDAPTIKINGGETLTYGSNNIVFVDLNRTITLEVEKTFNPSDFVLESHKPEIESSNFVDVSIYDDGATIMLTSKAVCKGDQMSLTIGGKTFTLVVDVYCNAESLSISYNSTQVSSIQSLIKELTFTTSKDLIDASHINVLVGPEGHTNTVTYKLISGQDCAQLNNGKLNFNKDGTARVRVLVSGYEEEIILQYEISITYLNSSQNLGIVDFSSNKTTEQDVVLNYVNGNQKEGVIVFNTPLAAEIKYEVVEGDNVVELIQPVDSDGNYRIKALRGGFATIQITATSKSQPEMARLMSVAESEQVWTVNVYVDKPLSTKNLDIKINGSDAESFRTSLENFKYSLSVFDDNGEMEGKEVYIVVDGDGTKVDGLSKEGIVNFEGKNKIEVKFEVRYAENVVNDYKVVETTLISLLRTVITTHGKLDETPEVLYASNPLSAGVENSIVIENVGKTAQLKVVEKFTPTDFDLKLHVKINSTANVEADVSADGTTITLTGLNLCKAEEMTLDIGGKTFKLVVDVNLNATNVNVSYNGVQTTEINTTRETLTFTTQLQQSASQINIKPDPKNSTNTIEYQLFQSDIAELEGNRLHFNSAGTAKVKIILKSSSGEETVSKDITITYTEPKPGEKNIDLTSVTEAYVVLSMIDPSNCDKGIVIFNKQEGATVNYQIESGVGLIEVSQEEERGGNYIITPLKGGFAKIKITASNSGVQTGEWTINVYIDYKLKENDFTITINGKDPENFRTSLESVNYLVNVDNTNGAMEGKKLQALINGIITDISNNYNGQATFTQDEKLEITFKVLYSQELTKDYDVSKESDLISVSKTISSTHGKLDTEPTINIKDGETLNFEGENKIVFADLNETITLEVEKIFNPSDFDLQSHHPTVNSSNFVDVSISEDGSKIMLTSKAVCSGHQMYLTIGGKTFKLVVDIYRNAESLSISYNGTQVSNIQTLIKELTFTISNDISTSLVNVLVGPEGHTNIVSYELISGQDCAQLSNGKLNFNKNGTAKVKIVVSGYENETILEKEISITYIIKYENQEVADFSGNNTTQQNIALDIVGEIQKEGVIVINTPSGTFLQYSILEDSGVVRLEQDNEIYKIVPLKGGFSTIQIEAIGETSDALQWRVNVYVDKPVSERNFDIEINDSNVETFQTSLETFKYAVIVSSNDDEMQGKELYIVVDGVETKIEGLSKNETINFNGKNEIEVRFEVRYAANVVSDYNVDQRALVSVHRTISTTHGKLVDVPSIKINGGETLTYGSNNIVFVDINRSITLEVEKTFNPSDFDLESRQPEIKSSNFVNVEISNGGATITLTSQAVCKGDQMSLTIGGMTFTLVVDVYCNAKTLSISYNGTQVSSIQSLIKELTFTILNNVANSYINVLVGPEGHTNTVSYKLISGQDCAQLSNEKLKFTANGVATVQVLVIGYGEETILQSEIIITYISKAENQEIADFSSNNTTEQSIVLNSNGEDKKEGIIVFNKPLEAEIKYEVVKGGGIVELIKPDNDNGIYRIEALRGGEATIQITATQKSQAEEVRLMSASAEVKVWTIEVYVDYDIEIGDITILLGGQNENEFRTSLDSVNYSVSVQDKNGSTEGKELYIVYNGQEIKADKFNDYANSISFTDRDSYDISFEIRYKAEITQKFGKQKDSILSVTRRVSTSRGLLDKAPTITYNGETLTQATKNNINFSNISEDIVLTITNTFSPGDFDLKTHSPSILPTNYVGVQISADGQQITLTSKDRCTSHEMSLSVGGYTFILSINIISKADTVKVTYNRTLELQSTIQYKRLVDSLSFGVVAERKDGKDIDNKNVEYSLDDSVWYGINLVDGEVSIQLNGASKIYFRSEDKGARTEIQIIKCDLSYFNVQLKTSSGALGHIDNVSSQSSADFDLPSNADYLTIEISIASEFLGGFGDAFEQMFKTETEQDSNWKVDYLSAACQITITFNNEKEFNRIVKIKYNTITLQLNLARVHIESIYFTGFNMKEKGDVYLGYQQVRVFAKHSYYNGQKVDYFRMPFTALKSLTDVKTSVSLDNITWKLSRFVGDKVDKVLTIQKGKKVTYDGKQYTIEQGSNGYVLKDQSGNIANGVTWVDVYSEPDYARIYFGNFAGLSESDVQNDYFGAFDDKPWTKPAKVVNNNSNRNFEYSANAFSFLRVEAGDGAENGINTHFNFNVLDDNTLVNVFDAAGYMANRRIVLHNSLYGDGELSGDLLTKAESDGLILNPTGLSGSNNGSMTQDIIYGNGYQVNIKAQNDVITDDMLDGGAENNGNATHFGTLYNVTLKGRNPHTDIAPKQDRLYLSIAGAYYSDIQYYSKMSISNGGTIKNTVLRYVASAALQLYYEGTSAYIENVVITECVKGLTLENADAKSQYYYFKGFFDVLNYYNVNGLKNAIKNLNKGSLLSGGVSDSLLPDDYGEWFGNKYSFGTRDSRSKDIYVNIALYSSRLEKNLTGNEVNYWNGSNGYTTDSSNSQSKLKIGLSLNVLGLGGFTGWTYDCKISADGGSADISRGILGNVKSAKYSRDMSKLFAAGDNIRLLCQYKDSGVKNIEHIQWHIQKVFRDPSLIKGREADHVQALKNSLNENDWDHTWPDGSKLSDALAQAASINKVLSTVILPKKQEI